MNLDTVITQLKTYAPIFNGNVAGAAEYANAVADQVWLPRPAAYVIPLQDEVTENQTMTGLVQVIREKIGIIVDLDNSMDRRGQAAATSAVDAVRAAIFKAILAWRSNDQTQARGFAYDGGGLINEGMNRAWLRWQFDFMVETTIDAINDGWQPPSIPLTDVEGIVTDQDTGTTLVQFDAAPPQT